MYKQFSRFCAYIIILLCGVACSLPGPGLGTSATSTPNLKPITSAHRSHRIIQICLDTPPLYPATTFTKAANLIANWIEADVTVNQDGFKVYVGEIRSRSFQINVVAPIEVPAIPADGTEPTPQPDYTPQPGENGYHATDMQATITAANDQGHTNWQNQVVHNHKTLATTLEKVKEETNALRSLTPPYDDKGADVYG